MKDFIVFNRVKDLSLAKGLFVKIMCGHHIKNIAIFVLVFIVMQAYAYIAVAQTTSRIGARFATAPAISSTSISDIDFGTWAVDIANGDRPSIRISAAPSGSIMVPVPSGISNSGTIIRNTIAPQHAGEILIQSPIVGKLQVSASVLSNFSDPNISLSRLTFSDSVSDQARLPEDFDGTTFITMNETSEHIWIGGTLTLGQGGGVPLPDTVFDDAVIEINVSY